MDTRTTRSQRTKNNVRNLALWTSAWLITMALVSFGSTLIWEGNTTISLTLIIVNAIVGTGMILANIRHLKGLDELEQKITMDAMAIALGVGVVGGLSYSMLDITNVIRADAEISFLVVLIAITYLIAIIAGKASIPVKNRIKSLRAERSMTQSDLAKAMDVSRQTINAIEKGKFDPSLPLAFRLARFFRLKIEEIFSDN